ncbi:MAG: hypothetical protein IPM08_17380 [Actinomycetales bacterium]|nr:hypothetical protein [Actinomycetales bacterium]
MTWDDDKVSALYYDAVTNTDPSSATIVMDVDGTAYPMDWDDPATTETRWDGTARQEVTTWRRTAHTQTAFAGAAVTAGAWADSPRGWTHVCEPRITIGTTVTPGRTFTIVARAAATP